MKTALAIIGTVVILVVAFAIGSSLTGKGSGSTPPGPAADNVSIVDGTQIIEITAKGGYTPEKISAKPGIPTVLRFKTNGTFDCSSALYIASMNIRKNLPPSGTTDIDIGTPQAGIFQGTCSMGMYAFEIEFKG